MIKFRSVVNSLVSNEKTIPIINLGLHGFADSFFNKSQEDEASESVPLICRLDEYSGLVQVENLTFAEDRYNSVDYSYTSSNSQVSTKHWVEFITSVNKRRKLTSSRILEIGSNDGFLLELTKAYTNRFVGVDASNYMVDLANKAGIRTIRGIFGESPELTEELKKSYHHFDFIFANNVVNHSNNPIKFISEIKTLLSKDGILVFEVPYWLETIKTYRFDQIYHEHITYFSIEAAEFLLNACDLYINDVQVVNYHGGSLRIYASFDKFHSSAKIKLLEIEKKLKLKDKLTYIEYTDKILSLRHNFMKKINQERNRLIFGVGAAAKGNTFLTYYGFNRENLKFILDSSPLKQGKITPVTKIPIVSDDIVTTLKGGTGIILAWNIGTNLKNKLLRMNNDLEFIDSFDHV
jgi:SAM-dependent methyltransferase